MAVFRDYKCTECKEIYEVREPVNSPTEQQCPKCGSKAKRMFAKNTKVIMGGTESEKLEKLSPKWD